MCIPNNFMSSFQIKSMEHWGLGPDSNNFCGDQLSKATFHLSFSQWDFAQENLNVSCFLI
jgi:hypothetical protein